MDFETKVFVWFSIIITVVFVLVAGFGMHNLESKSRKCITDGGIVVKTVDGWKCIKATVLKVSE